MKLLYHHLSRCMLYLYRVEKQNFESCPKMKLSHRQPKSVSFSLKTTLFKISQNFNLSNKGAYSGTVLISTVKFSRFFVRTSKSTSKQNLLRSR